MPWDEGLDGVHRAIAASDHRRIGILAGPGTGKTSFGLMRRLLRLLESGVAGDRILLLSFTRVAAADLRDKIVALGAPGSDRVRAMTLHSYCFGLLHKESVLAITRRIPRILLGHEVDLMLRDLGEGFGDIHERRRTLEALTAGWARTADEAPGPPLAEEDRRFGDAVRGWLIRHRAMLIGEVVPEAYRYLTTNPATDELTAFSHIIVDEYQDLNQLEQCLLDVLATNGNLCIAGDDDQSIYSVRYANPEGILRFVDREDVEQHVIEVCGRCPTTILDMANSLIAQAPNRGKGPLRPRDAAEPGTVAIVQWADTAAEVDGIVSAIAADLASGKREPGDILVLSNWRKIGEQIRSRLEELDIPVRSFFTEEELKSTEARRSLALLRLVVNAEDAAALRVLLGLEDQTGRTSAYQRLLRVSAELTQTPREVLERIRLGEHLGVNIPALITRYEPAARAVQRLRALESLSELIDALFPEDVDTVSDLRATALGAVVRASSAKDLLDEILESVTQDTVPQSPDFVRIMSLHKSKGLTSPAVFVVAAIDGIVPTITSDSPELQEAAREEGRRLFYVAITRASDELVISSSTWMDRADALARRVSFDPRTVRRSGDRARVRTIASPYIHECGRMAPTAQRGDTWLGSRA